MSPVGWLGRLAAPAVLVAAYLAPTVLDEQPYLLHILVTVCTFAIPAIGLNLMLGYTGLVSLGHMGFAGVGAYTAAVLMVDGGLGFWSATALAVVATAVAGALVGLLCLRLRSHFFIILTLAFGMIMFTVMNNWDAVTRGAEGFPGIPRPEPIALGGLELEFRSLPGFYYLAVTLTALVYWLQALIVRSDFGRTLAAIRQDETLAAFKGVDTMRYKVTIFSVGSAIAGFGGALQASFLRVAAPLQFDMVESINIVIVTIIGGAGYLAGPLVGAAIYVGLPEYLRVAEELRLVFFGVVLVLMTLFAPKGLAGLVASLATRGRSR